MWMLELKREREYLESGHGSLRSGNQHDFLLAYPGVVPTAARTSVRNRLQQLTMPPRMILLLLLLLMITPALIFCAWLVVLAATAAYQCPEECSCDTGGFTVDCSGLPSNTTPVSFPKYVKILGFYSYNLKFLRKDNFLLSKLTQLEELAIDECGIERVEPGAFNGLTMLIELSVYNNKISKIERGTFENLTTLKRLDLGNNRITNLEPETFLGLRNLRNIQLDNNSIEYIHPDMFLNAYNLESLNLSVNPLLEIPIDRHFISSPSLRQLDLSGCNISSISVATFSKVSDLNKLYLKYNDLKNIDVNVLKILPKLSELLIYQNPLSCDCQLQQVWRWCQNHSITTGGRYGGPECLSPSEVHGMWWGTLEYSQCSDDRITYHEGYNSVHYKYTDIKYSKDLKLDYFIRYVQTSVYAVLFTFGTIGNVIVLVIIACNNEMRTVPNMYIINLAISDLISLITNLFLTQAQLMFGTWQQTDHLCKFFDFLRRLSLGLSAYFVALLSYQRYKVTVDPLSVRVSSPVTWRVTAASISGVWIMAAIFAVPSALTTQKRKFVLCYAFWNDIKDMKVVLFELYALCVVPLCVIVLFYDMTARLLVKSVHTIAEEIHPLAIKRKNTAKIVVGLSIVFVISYVPYHITWVYFVLHDSMKEIELAYTYFISTWLLVLNSCLNPVALFCSSLAFRTKLKRCLMYLKQRRVVTTTQQLAEFRRA